MDKMLDRVFLDRTILIKEKIQSILGVKPDTSKLHASLRKQHQKGDLKKFCKHNRLGRIKTNQVQTEGYHLALQYMC
jgi:hypothetical protein